MITDPLDVTPRDPAPRRGCLFPLLFVVALVAVLR